MMKWMICVFAFTFILVIGPAPVKAANPFPTAKSSRFASNLQYTGGTATGFTLEQIRWGDHHNFERIVLEFGPPPSEPGDTFPRMKVETEFYPMRLAIRLPGSRSRSKNFLPALDLFGKSRFISGMDTFEVCGGGQHLTIIPARPVEFEVFTLTSPPRLVIDVILSRMPPMREEKKFSVRTLPLFEDQVCLFLEEAADSGITPRLITDAGGNVFGELGLYNEVDDAFDTINRFKDSLGKQFSLVVKSRGMMDTPAVLP
jgi:hypothetical protein